MSHRGGQNTRCEINLVFYLQDKNVKNVIRKCLWTELHTRDCCQDHIKHKSVENACKCVPSCADIMMFQWLCCLLVCWLDGIYLWIRCKLQYVVNTPFKTAVVVILIKKNKKSESFLARRLFFSNRSLFVLNTDTVVKKKRKKSTMFRGGHENTLHQNTKLSQQPVQRTPN